MDPEHLQVAQGQNFLPHHIKIMKVALALAILRQKPKCVSAREFTERLALQFGQLQTDWREKAMQCEQELLRTRQELVRYQACTETLSQPCPGHPPHRPATNGFLSQDSCYPSTDSEWQNSEYCPFLTGDSEGGGMGERGKERTMLEKRGHYDSEVGVNERKMVLEERIRAHVKFLSSVSSLVNAQHLSVVTTSDLRVTVRDTILSAVRGMSEALLSSRLSALPLPLKTMEAAVTVVVDILQMPVLSSFESELTEACVTLISSLTERLMQHRGVKKSDQLSIQSLICILCRIPRLFQHAVELMTKQAMAYIHTLNEVLEDCSCVDADVIENMAAMLRALETLLVTYDATSLPQEVFARLAELDTSLFEVSEAFPLFAYSVWKITALLSPPPET